MGDTVTLTVAAEPSKVAVPEVVGLTQARATKRLQDAGLGVKAVSEDTTDAAEDGRVTSADPAPGVEVDAGSTVTIVVGNLTEATPTPESTTP